MTKLVYLDCETTGLDPDLHEVWEIAIITHTGREYLWQIRPDLTHADPNALKVGRYWQRSYTQREDCQYIPDAVGVAVDMTAEPFKADIAEGVASEIAPLLAGAMIVGNNPRFDQDFLTRFLRKHGQAYPAHHRPLDAITFAAGVLHERAVLPAAPGDAHHPPFSGSELSRRLGIDPDGYDRHTALGDARMVRDLYAAITIPQRADDADDFEFCPHGVELDMCDTPACTNSYNAELEN